MILRNIAIRHGQKALAAPLRRSTLRTLTTETPSPEAIERSLTDNMRESNDLHQNLNRFAQTQSVSPPKNPLTSDPVVRDHNLYKTIRKRTHKLGSRIVKHYEPSELILNPPRPKDVTLELLMASQAHLGHSTSLWNPANQRYIFGVREGIHIISLEVIAAHLRRAAKVVEGVAYHGGLILFVGTRPGQESCVVRAAQLAGGCHLFERWIPGSITNGDQILRRCTIKVVDKDDNEIEGFEEKIADWRALKPDLVVVMDPRENYILLHECGLNNIPTIGVCDTDADPTWVTYPIPANDDSLRCIQLIAGVLGRAGEAGQAKRKEAAARNEVTWLPPPGLGKPVTEEDIRRAEAEKAAEKKEAEDRDRARENNDGDKAILGPGERLKMYFYEGDPPLSERDEV